MEIKFSDFKRKVGQGVIAPVYFFSGEETFLKEEALGILKNHFFNDPSSIEFNYNLFYASETSGEKILSSALTLPFLSSQRLVVVKEAEQLKHFPQENLVNYLENPPASTCLVLVSEKTESKNKSIQLIRDKAETVRFWPLYARQLPSWIMQRIITQGKKRISLAVAEYLQEIVGDNLWDLSQEIEKLLLYTQDKKEITIEDIATLGGYFRQHNTFEYIKALVKKELPSAVNILSTLCNQGEQPVVILAGIYRRFQKMLIAKKYIFPNQGTQSVHQAMKVLGISSFFEPDFPEYLKYFSDQQLQELLHLTLDADRDIKTGRKPARLCLEILSYKVCSL